MCSSENHTYLVHDIVRNVQFNNAQELDIVWGCRYVGPRRYRLDIVRRSDFFLRAEHLFSLGTYTLRAGNGHKTVFRRIQCCIRYVKVQNFYLPQPISILGENYRSTCSGSPIFEQAEPLRCLVELRTRGCRKLKSSFLPAMGTLHTQAIHEHQVDNRIHAGPDLHNPRAINNS